MAERDRCQVAFSLVNIWFHIPPVLIMYVFVVMSRWTLVFIEKQNMCARTPTSSVFEDKRNFHEDPVLGDFACR